MSTQQTEHVTAFAELLTLVVHKLGGEIRICKTDFEALLMSDYRVLVQRVDNTGDLVIQIEAKATAASLTH